MHSRRKTAFTILELLIVIGVVVLLAGIVLVSMRSITGGSRIQQTRITLQNLRSMLAEYETVSRLNKGPPAWGWTNGNIRFDVVAGTSVSGMAVDFWKAPFIVSDQATNPSPDPLDAPGSVATGGDINDPTNPIRNGSRQIINTQLAMNYILSLESNRKMVQGLAGDRYFIPQWQAAALHLPGPDRVKYTQDDPTVASEPVFYYPGNRVRYNGQVYRCLPNAAHASPPGTPPPPSQPGRWVAEGSAAEALKSQPTVMLLDAWDNPIVFVPASGLRVRMLNAESKLDPAFAGQTVVIVSPEGSATLARMNNTASQLVRPGRPFWVSAGPDGDFATGEDNLYSFEE